MKIVQPITVTDSMLTSSNVSEIDYPEYDSTSTYNVGDRVMVIDVNVHDVYEALASNSNKYPPDNPTEWVFAFKTNKWKMFDGAVTDQTTAAGSVDVTLRPLQTVDTVALVNVSATSVSLTVTDSKDGVVYTDTQYLSSPLGITDWYAYFYSPIIRATDYTWTDLPRYPFADYAISVTRGGEIAGIGECVIGMGRDLGLTQFGAQVGIQDYSVIRLDDWGNRTITVRNYAKRADFTLWVQPYMVDALQNILASYRATPVLWVGSDEYESTVVLGIYKDFRVEIAYSTYSVCTLSVEGMI